MGIKRGIKKVLFYVASSLLDVQYRHPYFDPDHKKRMRDDNKLLYLDLVLTECCTRRCRDCSNLMQYYNVPENISSDTVINDLKKILDCVCIGQLNLLGGEPFVNQTTLCEVLTFLSGSSVNRVDKINIITNGTIVPDDRCFNLMKDNSRVTVTFSNYQTGDSVQNEFIEACERNGVSYSVLDSSFYWYDFGSPRKYEESELFVKRQYKYCYNRKHCNTLYRGGFYVCPRQAHGIRLGLLPDVSSEYVDLASYDNREDLKQALLQLVRRKEPVSSCDYCIVGKYIHVPRGVQQK